MTKKTKKSKITFIILVIILVVFAVLVFVKNKNTSYISPNSTTSTSTPASTYANQKYRFSVDLPAGFSHREFAGGDGDTIIFENGKGEGIQILVSPFDDVSVLTADMVARDVPDMKISKVEVVEIGQGSRGIAFLSDNDAFGGASREVWFVWKSHLYQISTYERFDSILKSIFGTWKFTM